MTFAHELCAASQGPYMYMHVPVFKFIQPLFKRG